MRDESIQAALRFIGKRPYSVPGVSYYGDRANVHWSAFLMRLFPDGHAERPKFRVTRRP
jgi:hypothetical protein